MSSDQNTTNLQDDGDKQESRGGVPFTAHNRAERRRIAKGYKLFKDHSGDAWRIANKHMVQGRDIRVAGNQLQVRADQLADDELKALEEQGRTPER